MNALLEALARRTEELACHKGYVASASDLTAALERRLEELACHDRSCAPPPIGTGGSKPAGGSHAGGLGPNHRFTSQPNDLSLSGLAQTDPEYAKAMSGLRDRDRAAWADAVRARNTAKDERDIEGYRALNRQVKQLDRVRQSSLSEYQRESIKLAELETRGGNKIKVYLDPDIRWDMGLVKTSVNQFADLTDQFGDMGVPLAFGKNATVRAWHDAAPQYSYTALKEAFKENADAQAYVLTTGRVSPNPTVIGIRPSAAGKTNTTDKVNPGMFNPSFDTMSASDKNRYYVTHEVGHVLHLNRVKKMINTGEADSESAANLKLGIQTQYAEGKTTHDLRHPALGSYAYHNVREHAAESFAVDYYGWDDASGIPLESVLGWAYDD